MQIAVFYAWQSDRPGKVNHYLIRDAAQDACIRISSDKSNPWQVTLDSDTQGEAGMCDIPNTILKKIEKSDIMLADLTLVGRIDGEREKLTPNPNVVFELGYAAAKMAFPSLIGVMNEAFGSIDGQMFDTKRRGCITYECPAGSERSAIEKARKSLSADLEKAIRVSIEKEVLPRRKLREQTELEVIEKARDAFVSRVRSGRFHGAAKRPAVLTMIGFKSVESGGFDEVLRRVKSEALKAEVNENSIYWVDGDHFSEIDFRGWVYHAYCGNHQSIQNMAWLAGVGPNAAPKSLLTVTVQPNIVRQVHKFCSLFSEFDIEPPWRVSVSLVEAVGYSLLDNETREESPRRFDTEIVHFGPLTIETAAEVATYPDTGTFMAPILMAMCRKVGMAQNPCFTSTGLWNVRF